MSSGEQAAASLSYPAFWEAARTGYLEIQRCRTCRRLRYFPAPLCPHWSGNATLYAYTTVHRAPNAIMARETPYTIAFVDLDEGARVMGRLADVPADGARIGAPVRFDGVGDSGAGPWLRFRCVDGAA
jgi:uncharacterized OB-fold protein